jgi:hypothetical protein
VLALCLGGTVAAAHVESPTLSLLLAIALSAAALGWGGARLRFEAIAPIALLALVSVLLVGAAARNTLPRPAVAWELDSATVELRPELMGSASQPGGKNAKPVLHRVMPLVPRGWQPGDALDLWVLDPPASLLEGARVRALRLPLLSLPAAQDAYEAARRRHALVRGQDPLTFVELTERPDELDAQRRTLFALSLLAVTAPWLIGVPLTRGLRRLRAWLGRRG